MTVTTVGPSPADSGPPFTHRQPGSTRATIRHSALGLVAAAAIGCLLVPWILQHRADVIQWKAAAPRIERALNDTYVEPVKVTRTTVSHGRSGADLVETITINGTVRKDCTIPTSFTYGAPTVSCTDPLILTPEPVRPLSLTRPDPRPDW